MSAVADFQLPDSAPARVKLDHPIDMRADIAFLAVLAGGLYFMAYSIYADVAGSGFAGTMMANGSGLQWSTLRNLALAWVLTLPCAILLSGTLYFIFRHIF